MNRNARLLSKMFSSHLLIKILTLLFMLKIGNEFLYSLYHLSFGEVLFLEDAFQLIEEPIYLGKWVLR